MALQVWLPLNGNLNNYGVSNMKFSNTSTSTLTVDASGKLGSCYKRSSIQTAGRIISDTTINLSSDISMCCWAKVTGTVGDTANGLVSNHSHANNTGFGITVKQVSSSDFRISCNTGNGSSRTYCTYYGNTNIKDAWHHLALTYSSKTQSFSLWVDGVAEKTVSYTNAFISDYIMVFDWSTTYSGSDYKPACSINDVRIYDHCLSKKEIKEIAKGLVLHYPLNDGKIEETINLNEPSWSAYTSYFTIQSQTANEIKLVNNGGSTYVALGNDTVRAKLIANTTFTVSGYLYKGDTPYKTTVDRTTSYNSVTVISSYSDDTGFFSFTMKYGNVSDYWIIHYPLFGSVSSGDVCYIRNMQWEYKDHATPYVNGSRGFKYDNTVYVEPDGSKWARIAHHNNPANGLFSQSNDFPNGVYIDSNRWFNVFAVIKQLNSYEFMVKQTATSSSSEVKYRWIQYASPLTATYDNVKPAAVTRITTSGYTDGGYGGLKLYSTTSSTYMHIANTSSSNWFGAFGAWEAYNGGIPGYPNTTVTTGYMDLYVRVDSIYKPEIIDASGYKNNGLPVGNLTMVKDSKRYDITTKFSATETNYIDIPYQYLQGPYSDNKMTFTFWIKTNQSGNRHMIFGIKNSYYTNIELYTANELRVYWNNSPDWFPGITCTLNEWTFIAVVVGPSYVKCYKNGSLIGTNSITTSWPGCSGDFMIGSDQRIGTYFLGSQLSDFRIYSTLLSDSDILELYNTSALIDKNGDLMCYQANEIYNNVSGRELGPHVNKGNSNVVFNTDGSYTISGHTWPSADYIPISPTGKTYYYDIEYSNVSGNLFYIGFEKYDANYGTGSNQECQYQVGSTDAADHKRIKGTINLATANGNTAAYTRLRILNDWNSTGTASYKGTIHHISLKEVSSTNGVDINKKGMVNADDFIESSSASINKIGNVTCNQLIEF